jgi:hypothetical protein
MPLDAIGQAYVDWVLSRQDLPDLVNVVHPRPTTWDIIYRGIREELGNNLPLIPLKEWLAKLEARLADATPEDLAAIVSTTSLLDSLVSNRSR